MATTVACAFRSGIIGICAQLRIYHGSTITMPVRRSHWFTKYYKRKWVTRPITNAVLEKYKERSGVKLPDVKSAPAMLRKYLDDTVPESVKRIHSLEFMNIEAAIQEVVREKLLQLGLNPGEDSTAHEVVRLTIRIRVQRELMERGRNSGAIERGLLEMIDRRDGLLRLLRSEDYAQFLSLSELLELTFAHAARPSEAEPPRPGFPQRLAETRARCQQLKLRRLAELAARTEAAKADFVGRRDSALADAREKLASLGLSLEQTLDEVYADRRAAAEAELLEDKLHWYYGEQREHLKYTARLAEKAAKAGQTRGRK